MSGGADVATVTRFVDNECIDHGQRMRLEGPLSLGRTWLHYSFES